MRGRQAGRLGVFFALIATLVVLLAAAGTTVLYGRLQLAAVGAGTPVVVTVRSGETLDQVAADLQSQGLIRSSFWFSAYARIRGVKLRSGQYQVDSGMAASEIVSRLEGPQYCPPVKIVIPEGFTVDQIASRVASTKGLEISRQEYLDAVAHGSFNAPFLSSRPPGDTSLEGFLFPATYTLPDCTSAHDLVQMQLDGFGSNLASQLPSSGAKAYADLIIASMVQAEALAPDFTAVASVIDNRLAVNMRLQIDATVVYGLNQAGQAMSAADEAIDTPYNTYLRSGLPPTPIGNPGVATFDAALHPASTPYLYYVTDPCGHNHYSVTETQHEQQVRQYGSSC